MTTSPRYAIRPAHEAATPSEEAAAVVVADVADLVAVGRALVASGLSPLEAAARAITKADPKTVVGAALLALIAALRTTPSTEPSPSERPN